MFVRLAAAAALLVPGAAASAEDGVRQPTGKWVVEYADDMCLLQREYGAAAALLTLAFKPEPMSDRFTAYVFKTETRQNPAYVSANIQFGAGTAAIKRRTASYYFPKLNARVADFWITREELSRAAASELISIDAKDRLTAAFQVPGLSSALTVLDD